MVLSGYMILVAYRHGLRASELVALRWDQVDLDTGRLQVIQRKGSDDSVQVLSGVEIRHCGGCAGNKWQGRATCFHMSSGRRSPPMASSSFSAELRRVSG